jgi:hypothetical protein
VFSHKLRPSSQSCRRSYDAASADARFPQPDSSYFGDTQSRPPEAKSKLSLPRSLSAIETRTLSDPKLTPATMRLKGVNI